MSSRSGSNKNNNHSLDNLLSLFDRKEMPSSTRRANIPGSNNNKNMEKAIAAFFFLFSFFALGFAIMNTIYMAKLNQFANSAQKAINNKTNKDLYPFSDEERMFLFVASIIMSVVFFAHCVALLIMIFRK